MTRHRPLYIVPIVLATATVFLMDEPGAAKPPSASSGTAQFDDTQDDTIQSDGDPQRYIGSFDGAGNFSFNTGTQRLVEFVFGDELSLFGGQTAPPQATVPLSGLKDDVTFSVLAPTSGGSLLTIQPGSPEVRSVRFLWPNNDGTGIVSNYGLHFRGNALLDDDGDGVPNESFDDGDGTEMSKMLTTCQEVGLGGCVEWTMTPCAGYCGDTNADPDGSVVPIGQLYGTFPRKTGNRPIARFKMQWGLTICRITSDHPCPLS